MIEDENLIKGARHNLPIVTNLEDKATAIEEEYNAEGIANSIVRGLKSMIGEISNYATCYHNKCPKTKEQKDKYDDYINLLSVCNGVEICKSLLV